MAPSRYRRMQGLNEVKSDRDKSKLDGCPLSCAAARHRVSTFPGAGGGGWQLINKTGALQRLLERSMVSGQLPLLPQESREESQATATTVLSSGLLSRGLPVGKIRASPSLAARYLAARCLVAKWHSLTSDTRWVSTDTAIHSDISDHIRAGAPSMAAS